MADSDNTWKSEQFTLGGAQNEKDKAANKHATDDIWIEIIPI